MDSFDSEKQNIIKQNSSDSQTSDHLDISISQDFSEIIPQNKSIIKKIFQNEQKNYNIAIFTIINTALGPGFLALPHAIANWGLIPGFFMLIVGAVNMYISQRCLFRHILKWQERFMVLLWKLLLIQFFLYIVLGFQQQITQYVQQKEVLLIDKLIEDTYFRNEYQKFTKLNLKYEWILFLILIIITFPFALFSSTKRIKSFLKMTFLAIVLIYETPFFIRQNKPTIKLFNFNLNEILTSYGNFIYSYNTVVTIFVVLNKIRNYTNKQMGKLFRTGQIAVFVFYVFTAISGFVCLGDDNKNYDLIILRKPLKGSNDILMKISISCILKSISYYNICWLNYSYNTIKIIIFLLYKNQIFKNTEYYNYFIYYNNTCILCIFISIFQKVVFFTWIILCYYIGCNFTRNYDDKNINKKEKQSCSIFNLVMVYIFYINRFCKWDLFSHKRTYQLINLKKQEKISIKFFIIVLILLLAF